MMHREVDDFTWWMAMDASALDWLEEKEQLGGVTFRPTVRYRFSTHAMLRDPLKWARNQMRSAGQRVLRAVASVLLAVTILFATILTVSPTARAMVKKWLMEWCNCCVVYCFTDYATQGDPGDYELTYVPEGYLEVYRVETPLRKIVRYKNNEGKLLSFICQTMRSGTAASLWTNSIQAKSIEIQGCPSELLISVDASNVNTLVWHDTECNLQFSLHGFVDEITLIAMAESIKVL